MRKIILRVLLVIVLLVVVVIGGMLIYVKTALPNVGPAPDIKVEITPERIQRGEYLANHVWLCMDCHSERDWTKFSGPPIHGTEGGGGEEFTQAMGLPGLYVAPNITPGNIGDWTDGEIFRAMTSGVTKDGKALFPLMPYLSLGKADREDVYSVIAYIRTLPAIKNSIPVSESDFPMNFIINTIPTKPNLHPKPDITDKVAYGKYLAMVCIECHTVDDNGKIIMEKAFQGGRGFLLPSGGTVYSMNLTPDDQTGLGKWTEKMFIARFKAYADSSYVSPVIQKNTFNTIMPWMMFSGMKYDDLSAIYAYLRSLEPKKNAVTRFIPD